MFVDAWIETCPLNDLGHGFMSGYLFWAALHSKVVIIYDFMTFIFSITRMLYFVFPSYTLFNYHSVIWVIAAMSI